MHHSIFWFVGLWFIFNGSTNQKDYEQLQKMNPIPIDPRPTFLILGLGFIIRAWLKTKYGV